MDDRRAKRRDDERASENLDEPEEVVQLRLVVVDPDTPRLVERGDALRDDCG